MHFERLSSAAHPMYETALSLYRASFPPHEQREPASQERIMRNDEYHFNLIWDGDAFVGLMLCWETADFVYVEHFCILPALRNQKYGQRALSLLARQGKTVILEIDPPVNAISVRRKGFYARCGFAENPFAHVHPPYHRENHGHALVIMSLPGPIAQETYDAFRLYLDSRVMDGAFA